MIRSWSPSIRNKGSTLGHPFDPFGEDRQYFKERIEAAALFAPPEERNPNFFEEFGRDDLFI